MRKVIRIKPETKEGDTKEILKFAFFPKYIHEADKKILIWLERYIVVLKATKVLEAKPDAIGMYGVWLAHHNEWEVQWKKEKELLYDKDK